MMKKNKAEKKHKIRTLFSKYISFFIAVEVISLTVFGIVLGYFLIGTWEAKQKTTLFDFAENIASTYEDLLNSGEDTDYKSLCHSIASVSDGARADIYIVDSTGKVIFCRDMAETENGILQGPDELGCEHSKIKLAGEFFTGIIADGILATESSLGNIYPDNTFVSAATVRSSLKSNEPAIVIAAQSSKVGLTPYVITFLQIYVLDALLMLIVTCLVIYISTYSITRPLKDMSEATKQYAIGNFAFRIKPNRNNTVREFDELSSSMNAMAASLEQFEHTGLNLVANVSHEFKTPMTTIGGFIDGMLDGTIAEDEREHYLGIVSEEIKRLSRLVIAMLNMSKIESGEMRIDPKRFNLTEQIWSIFVSFEQNIESKHITVKGFEYLSSKYIEADSDMINQVFYNLIDNAVKFTQQNGEIEISMADDPDFVSVSIKNTGKGIAPEDLMHVFERFYKGDKSRGLDSKSAGLGLFIVQNIVKLHDGEITVASEQNGYTQFTVKLHKQLIGG